MRLVLRSPLWVVLLLATCVRVAPEPPPVPPPAPPPRFVVPPGCEAELTGRYVREASPRLFWELSDDLDAGTATLTLRVEEPVDGGPTRRRFSRDGGLPWLVAQPDAGVPELDAGPRVVSRALLTRTREGFFGSTVPTDGGCAFPVRVAACPAGALVFESPSRVSPTCEGLDAGWRATRLLLAGWDAGASGDARADAGPPDTLRQEDGGPNATAEAPPDR